MTEQQRDDINKLLALAKQRYGVWVHDPEKYATVLEIFPPVIERMERMMGWDIGRGTGRLDSDAT